MTSMVEKVARAIWPDRWAVHDGLRENCPDLWESPRETELRNGMIEVAKRALESLRHPDDRMVEAGAAEMWKHDFGTFDDALAAKRAWQAMLQAAMTEEA